MKRRHWAPAWFAGLAIVVCFDRLCISIAGTWGVLALRGGSMEAPTGARGDRRGLTAFRARFWWDDWAPAWFASLAILTYFDRLCISIAGVLALSRGIMETPTGARGDRRGLTAFRTRLWWDDIRRKESA